MGWIKDLFLGDGHVTEGGYYRLKHREAKDKSKGGGAAYVIERASGKVHQHCEDRNGNVTHSHFKDGKK